MAFQSYQGKNPKPFPKVRRKAVGFIWRAMILPSLLLTILVAMPCKASEETEKDLVRVMTFNIRYNTPADGENAWPHRKEFVLDVIREFRPDFLGLQEALPEQVAFLREALSEYGLLSRSREKDPNEGEACSVFYLKQRWVIDPLEQGTYWLSDTPDEPASITWGNACTRIVTWARFTQIDTGRPLVFINTHFDHRSAGARRASAVMLRDRIAAFPDSAPVVLVGDFNASETDDSMRILREKPASEAAPLVDSYRAVHPSEEKVGTFNGFAGTDTGAKIDHIFVRGGAKVIDAAIIRVQRDGRYPSDHFPVTATIRLCPAE